MLRLAGTAEGSLHPDILSDNIYDALGSLTKFQQPDGFSFLYCVLLCPVHLLVCKLHSAVSSCIG